MRPPAIKAEIRRRRGTPPKHTWFTQTGPQSSGGGVPPLLWYTHSRVRCLRSASGGGMPPLKIKGGICNIVPLRRVPCQPHPQQQIEDVTHLSSVLVRCTYSRAAEGSSRIRSGPSPGADICQAAACPREQSNTVIFCVTVRRMPHVPRSGSSPYGTKS